jgi:hypothetical protein
MKLWFSAAAFAALTLSGCVQKDAWSHFDECSGSSFVAMVDCGRSKRTAYCATASNCGPNGAAVVQYVESLKQSVQRGEMSEPEATRKWLEYRNSAQRHKAALEPTVIILQ